MMGDSIIMPLSPAAANRAAIALSRVLSLGESFTAASRAVGTTNRTLYQYVAENSIPIQRLTTGRWEVIRTPTQKVPELLELMSDGLSATAACSELNTTVSTMSSQMLPNLNGDLLPVIVKIGNSWTPNFIGVREYSMTLHGQLLGFNDSVQGRGLQQGPNANQDEADPEYADIWWQLDLNSFQSTLPINEVGEFYQPDIMLFLRDLLERPAIANAALANRFLGNLNVANNAVSTGRIDNANNMALTMLEEFLERYDIRMGPDSTIGVEPAIGLTTPIEYLSLIDWATTAARIADGVWQVMFLTDSNLEVYPIPIQYEYTILNE